MQPGTTNSSSNAILLILSNAIFLTDLYIGYRIYFLFYFVYLIFNSLLYFSFDLTLNFIRKGSSCAGKSVVIKIKFWFKYFIIFMILSSVFVVKTVLLSIDIFILSLRCLIDLYEFIILTILSLNDLTRHF